jgi:hypothetical protein
MGTENSITSEDSIFRPENEHHSVAETASKTGAAWDFHRWQGEGADFFTAYLLADIEANVEGADAVTRLIGGDMHARLVRDDCAGHFDTIDDDYVLGVHIALQQLLSSTKSSLESLHAHMSAAPK